MKTARGGSAAGRQAVGAVVGPPRTRTHPLGAPRHARGGGRSKCGHAEESPRRPHERPGRPDASGHAGNQQTESPHATRGAARAPPGGRRARRSLQLLPVVGQVASALPSDANQLPGRPEAPARAVPRAGQAGVFAAAASALLPARPGRAAARGVAWPSTHVLQSKSGRLPAFDLIWLLRLYVLS